MAIARKIDPAALARSVANDLRDVPEVKRLWYYARPGLLGPELLSVGFYFLIDPDTKAAQSAIVDALERVQIQYFDETSEKHAKGLEALGLII